MKLRHDSVRVLNHPVKVKNEENTNFNVVELNSSIIKDSLSSLNNKTNDLNVNGCSQIHLNSVGGTAVKADSNCVIQPDPEKREGWNCVNSTVSTKFNLYLFDGLSESMTLGDVKSVYFKGAVNAFSNSSSVPFLHVYTKPTGINDAGFFYHSKIDYTYNNDNTIGIGEECLFYGIGLPNNEFGNRKIQLNNKIVSGEGLDNEAVLYVVCASDSGAVIDKMNTTLNLVGFETENIRRNYKLVSGERNNNIVLSNNESYGSNQTSSSINLGCKNNINILGSASVSVFIEGSGDNVNFYELHEVYPSSNNHLYKQIENAPQYIRIKNSNQSNTITIHYNLY
tara:strand:+ start:2047 stop:3063 length:1017 start_codon:yes stop_codon:yes gene_type:complete